MGNNGTHTDDMNQDIANMDVIDFKYEYFGNCHWFEMERRHSLTNRVYWLIGILMALMGAFGYLWANRISNMLFFLLMCCIGVFCLIALAIAICAAWPRKYQTLEGSENWEEYWRELTNHNKNCDVNEKYSFYNFKLTLLEQFVSMETENRQTNDSREKLWIWSSKLVIVILIMVLLGVVCLNFFDFNNEVKKVFESEVNKHEPVETSAKSTITTISTVTTISTN